MEKVLRMVGETALRVSRRRLVEFLPKQRFGCVSRRNLGRLGMAAGRWDNMGRVAVADAMVKVVWMGSRGAR